MLQVTVDAFSGRPNPSWTLAGSEAQELLTEVSRNRDAVTDIATGYSGLGFRGVILETLSDELIADFDMPEPIRIGGGGSTNDAKGLELSERIIRSMQKYQDTSPFADTAAPFDQALEEYLLKLLDMSPARMTESDTDVFVPAVPSPADAVVCYIERWKFNPAFWNRPEVIGRNNCYNYASNWRTDTFAQPGSGAGKKYTALTCAEVTRAALADGCHRRFDCFPDAEKPRFLVALVVAPGFDYHWYRQHTLQEGFWGHKPGGTAARNTDNKGVVITNPETCARGPYTDFCGYFYTCNTQRHRIR